MEDSDKLKSDIRRVYQSVFKTPEGAVVLRDILRRNNALTIVASTDKEYSSILEGQRRAALSILHLVHPNVIDIICEHTHSSSIPTQIQDPDHRLQADPH